MPDIIMNKLIIDTSDERYKYLELLWSTYDYNNLIVDLSHRSWRCLVPRELILTKVGGSSIGCRNLNKFLLNNCKLTLQEYFDLLVLHINNTDDRPRCSYSGCTDHLRFISFSQGYGSLGPWNPDARHYCSNTHQRLDHEGRNKESLNSILPTIKRQRSTFISKSKGSIGYLYITRLTSGGIKYGITEDILKRVQSMRFGNLYINPHMIFRGSIEEVANLEASLKLELSGKEYLLDDELHNLMKLIRTKLAVRPIANPFD